MPTVTSLDGVDLQIEATAANMEMRDLAAKLRKHGSLKIQNIHRDALVTVSQWLSYLHNAPWEVGLVQDPRSKLLRLVDGEATTSFRLGARIGEKYLRKDDIFIIHVHPVVNSRPEHVDTDRKTATDALEGVLDWSGRLLCYDHNRLYNEPDRRSPTTRLKDAAQSVRRGKIPFMEPGGVITGYRHFDKTSWKPTFVNPFDPFQ
jgi:hypothetical protein